MLDAAPETAFDRYVVPELAVLYRVARGLTAQPADAEDLVQDTLVRAFRAIGSFDGRHPMAWLLTILRRAHLNRVRRRLPHLMDSADFLHDRRQSLYAAVVGVHITMLGFAFATLTVVLGYAQSPRFQVLRDSRWFSALFSVFINALRAFALGLRRNAGGALVRPEQPPRTPADDPCGGHDCHGAGDPRAPAFRAGEGRDHRH